MSDEEPDDTILEKTVVPSESASSVELPDDSTQPQLCAQTPAERSNSNLIEDLVASLSSSAGAGPDRTADSAIVPVQRTYPSVLPTTQSSVGSSISVAASAPLRSESLSSSAPVAVSSSVIVSSVPAPSFSLFRDPSAAHPRVDDPGPSNLTSEWSFGVRPRYGPSRLDPCRGFGHTRLPPPMSFLGGLNVDRSENGPSGLNTDCPRDTRDNVDLMSIAQIAVRTSTIVKDLSTMLGGKRVPEIDNLVKGISSELTPVMHKRDYFRTLSARYHAIVDEFRTQQCDADQRALDDLRQVANDFVAGVPLLTDGQLSFEGACAGPSGSSGSSRVANAGYTQQSGTSGFPSNAARALPSTVAAPPVRRDPSNPLSQTAFASEVVNPALAELLTPDFLMECTPSQVAAIKPVYQRYAMQHDEAEPTEEDKRRADLAAMFPALFAQPSPRTMSRAPAPAVDARKSLNFATPGSTVWNRGSTLGTSALTAGTQSAAVGATRTPAQSVEDLIEQKVSAAIASRDQKTDSSILQEDSAFVSDTGIVGALRNSVAPECKVPIFKRGNRDMTIENWFFQMRNYFETYAVDSRHWVNICVTRIHTSHFREISPLVCYNYTKFRSECVKLFESPDLTQAYLSELTELAQAKDEDYETYYERVRELISKAHPSMGVSERESLMVSYFIKGLYDSRVRDVVAATPGISLAEALRRASSVAASRRRSEPSGPPVRKALRDRSKDSESTYSASYARPDVGSSQNSGHNPYWQLTEQPGIVGNQFEDQCRAFRRRRRRR